MALNVNPGQVVLARKLEGAEITTSLIKTQDFQEQYESLSDLVDYLSTLKKAIDSEIKEVIMKDYVETGESTISTDKYNFTYVGPSTKKGFDTKKLAEEHPDIYLKYVKISNVADSIRVAKKKAAEKDKDSIEADFSELK